MIRDDDSSTAPQSMRESNTDLSDSSTADTSDAWDGYSTMVVRHEQTERAFDGIDAGMPVAAAPSQRHHDDDGSHDGGGSSTTAAQRQVPLERTLEHVQQQVQELRDELSHKLAHSSNMLNDTILVLRTEIAQLQLQVATLAAHNQQLLHVNTHLQARLAQLLPPLDHNSSSSVDENGLHVNNDKDDGGDQDDEREEEEEEEEKAEAEAVGQAVDSEGIESVTE